MNEQQFHQSNNSVDQSVDELIKHIEIVGCHLSDDEMRHFLELAIEQLDAKRGDLDV